jgi:hypothetical protein
VITKKEGPRLFVGCYPTGFVYADRHVERHGDYKRLAYLNYESLLLDLEPDCPIDLALEIRAHVVEIHAKAGTPYQIAGNMTVILGGEKCRTLNERLKDAGYETRKSAQYQKAIYKDGRKVFEGFALDTSRWLDQQGVAQ